MFFNLNIKFHAGESAAEEDEELYVVEFIIKERMKHGERQFLVHWEGFDHSEDSWIPQSNLSQQVSDYKFLA